MSVSTVSGYATDKYPLVFSIGKVHLLFLSFSFSCVYFFYYVSHENTAFHFFQSSRNQIPKAISMSEVSIKQTGNEVFVDCDLCYELSLRITWFSNL